MHQHLIWDLPVRLFHWLLVLCMFAQWLTAEVLEDAMNWHFWFGYATLGLLIYRLIWGFIGSYHARFRHFIPSPSAAINYAKGKPNKQYLGHNPLGALMVILMLVLIALQAVSGLFISDDMFNAGPYNAVFSETWDKWMARIHHQLFDGILIAIGLHVAAVLFYVAVKKQALIRAMLTGKKSADAPAQAESKVTIKAVILLLIVAALVYWLVEIAPPVPEEFYY